ncbi:MAG: ribonuclease H-like domain-containing protein [Lachnospiraceae bacterium]|nr:ribonuclease H-like domain-containing protein [Lachnospiraceae bacterium]
MRYVEQPLTELVDAGLLPVMEAWLTNDAYCPIGDSEPVWFDIETTGLSSSAACVYMIGAVMRSCGEWRFCQWFSERPTEEVELLQAFAGALPADCALLHYNGTTFDLPFLRDRCRFLHLDITWPTVSVDLYSQLRKLKRLAGLPSCRQRDLEPYAGYPREDPYDGGTLIAYYGDFIKHDKIHRLTGISSENGNPAEELYAALARHNREDLAGLVSLTGLYDCFEILKGDITDAELAEFGDAVSLTLLSDRRWPEGMTFSVRLADRHLTLPKRLEDLTLTIGADADGRLTLRIPILTEPAKHFYDNYRDYFYLPVEGRVVHKSIAAHMDRSYCRPAKRDEAFDWFRGELLPQVGEVLSPCFLYNSKDRCLLFPAKELPKHPERVSDYAKGLLTLFLNK